MPTSPHVSMKAPCASAAAYNTPNSPAGASKRFPRVFPQNAGSSLSQCTLTSGSRWFRIGSVCASSCAGREGKAPRLRGAMLAKRAGGFQHGVDSAFSEILQGRLVVQSDVRTHHEDVAHPWVVLLQSFEHCLETRNRSLTHELPGRVAEPMTAGVERD